MHVIAFFQTLRGKLILTYTTVTVLALLALEITILLVALVFSRRLNADTQAYLSDVVSVLPPQARLYLQPNALDLVGLQAWLQSTYDAGYASLPPQGLLDSPAASIVKSDLMYVISPDGTVLAAAPASAKSLAGGKYSPPSNVTSSKDILANALQLDLQSGDVSAIGPDGNYLMAVPVRQSQGEGPLAAVIIVTVKPPPPGLGALWPVILGIVLATAFILLLAVAPFGALFGFIMSRGLTRRLKALTLAADAWSEGDFSFQPQDHSKDEISYLGMHLRRMAENLQALLQTRQELTLLEERNRLARELHDTVKQETFATLMQVRAAKNLLEQDPSAARQRLEAAEELIKTAQQDLGLVISELQPAALEGQGLVGALGDYLATWSQHSRIPANIQVQGEHRLPLEVEQTLFRVAQEALSNVARHSRASAATLCLAFDPGKVTLRVVDNGIGFDFQAAGFDFQAAGSDPSAAVGSGFGLQSMRDRMAAIQGDLVVQAAPDGGAIVTASAPILCQEQT
jgi:NarL family two-component system sensor histidine kinase LiaS